MGYFSACNIFIKFLVGQLSSRFVTINSTSIKPSIKVRNLTYYIFGKVYNADSLLAYVNNDKDTHKDKYKYKGKDKERRNFQEERVHV